MSTYEMQVRDANMRQDKARMMAQLSHAQVKAGGCGVLPDAVIKFIETCARNGIHLNAEVRVGPYEQKMHDDGRQDWS